MFGNSKFDLVQRFTYCCTVVFKMVVLLLRNICTAYSAVALRTAAALRTAIILAAAYYGPTVLARHAGIDHAHHVCHGTVFS